MTVEIPAAEESSRAHYESVHESQDHAAPPHPRRAPLLRDPRRKAPLLAVVLSAMPGLGQVYVGYYKRAFIHALVVATLLTLLSTAGALGPLTPLASVFLAFFWLYNMVDAGRRAALYNQALAGGQEIQLPADFGEPGFRGSVLGGAILAAVGSVLLAHTRFGVSLDWIEDWWPLALVVFGAYLAFKGWQERGAGGDPSETDL